VASTITQYSNLININFPVPGEDNDSQGFRTNFAKIQNALSVASQEITNVQVNAVNLSDTNDFGTNVVKRVALQNSSVVVNDAGSVSSAVSVDYSLGSYQKFSVDGGSYTFTVVNWPPAGQCGTVRVEITPTSASEVSINFGGTVNVLSKTSLPIIYKQDGPIVWELWSPDAGSTLYAHELGLPNSVVTGTSIVASDNIKIGKNMYSVRAVNSATVVQTGELVQQIALIPHITTATIVEYGCSSDINTSTTATSFIVDSIKNITTGSAFWFNSLDTRFTITSIDGNTINTQQFNRAALTSDPVNTRLRFVQKRYNLPNVLHFTNVDPVTTQGQKYHLAGQVYVTGNRLWVAYGDHSAGSNSWLPVATMPGDNVFTGHNHFTQPVGLPNYTVAEAYAATAHNGDMCFVTGSYNRPAYYSNGIWYVLGVGTALTFTGSNIDVNPGSATWYVSAGGGVGGVGGVGVGGVGGVGDGVGVGVGGVGDGVGVGVGGVGGTD
jgi:hypothetical protein